MSVYRGSQGQPGSPSLRYQKTHINPTGDLPGGETGPQGSRLTGSSISSSSWGAAKRTSKRKFSDTTDTYVINDLPEPERQHRGQGSRGLVRVERGSPGSAWAACYKLYPL